MAPTDERLARLLALYRELASLRQEAALTHALVELRRAQVGRVDTPHARG